MLDIEELEERALAAFRASQEAGGPGAPPAAQAFRETPGSEAPDDDIPKGAPPESRQPPRAQPLKRRKAPKPRAVPEPEAPAPAPETEPFARRWGAGLAMALPCVAIQALGLRLAWGEGAAEVFGGWALLLAAAALKIAAVAGVLAAAVRLVEGEWLPPGDALGAAALAAWVPEIGFWIAWPEWTQAFIMAPVMLWLALSTFAICWFALKIGDELLLAGLVSGQVVFAFAVKAFGLGALRAVGSALESLLG